MIPHKALFGSDAPSLPLERWLADFEQLPIKPEVRQKIMLDNAVKLFGLEDRVAPPSSDDDQVT
jgi:predicted TIM-barrel fold metal-dependent hydrolase